MLTKGVRGPDVPIEAAVQQALVVKEPLRGVVSDVLAVNLAVLATRR